MVEAKNLGGHLWFFLASPPTAYPPRPVSSTLKFGLNPSPSFPCDPHLSPKAHPPWDGDPLCSLPPIPARGSGQVYTTCLHPRLSDLNVCRILLGGGPGPHPAFPGQEGGPELSPGPEPSPAAAAAVRDHGRGGGCPVLPAKQNQTHVPATSRGRRWRTGSATPVRPLRACPSPNS